MHSITSHLTAAAMALSLSAIVISAQDPVIVTLQANGRLIWTNSINSNVLYRVEWSSQANGPWYRTFDSIASLDSHDSSGFTVSVPMFYRVVAESNSLHLGMMWIDGGDVELGQIGIATPVHTNFISGFWFDETEVSKTQWDLVANWASSNGYDISSGSGLGKTNSHPVQNVSWYECVKWCNARSQREGLTPCYYIDPIFFNPYKNGDLNISNSWVNWSANGYRLPTEAEWEKASRGGRQRRLFPWGGDTIQHTRANYVHDLTFPYDTSETGPYHPLYEDGVFPYTSPVGSFRANAFGLHDMAGNVWEWCWDWYGDYSPGYQTDPHGPMNGQYGTQRILRGGSWKHWAFNAMCANRAYNVPASQYNDIGFRCARGP